MVITENGQKASVRLVHFVNNQLTYDNHVQRSHQNKATLLEMAA